MNWDPDRDERLRRHSLDYRVPRDRQIISIEIISSGDAVLITDTRYPMDCIYCDEQVNGPTKVQSTELYRDHMEEQHPGFDIQNQYDLPDWFREMMQSREADIARLQHDHEEHDN